MAEEPKQVKDLKEVIDKDVDSKSPEKEGEEKQTNKIFTQSDVDKLIGREVKKVKDQFKDYDGMKEQLDQLVEEKKKLELSEKTEIEKKEIAIKELQDKLVGMETNYTKILKVNLRNEVLNDSKYSGLPKVYRQAVKLSDDEAEIRDSADQILEEYLRDIESLKGKESYGKPITKEGVDGNNKPKTLADRVKQKIESHFEHYKAMQGGLSG